MHTFKWFQVSLYHHHHVALSARIFLTLSRHPSLSSIVFGRSSVLHSVLVQSYCMYVRAGRPAFARPCEGVHRSTSLTSSSLLLQQCPACLVRLIFIVFMTGGRWPYSCCFVGCCLQDLFNIALTILCNCRQVFSPYVLLASTWCIHIVVIDITASWKKLRFLLSVRSDFHMTDSLSIAVPCLC